MISTRTKLIVKIFKGLAIMLTIAGIIKFFIIEPGQVSGVSMDTTYKSGEWFLVDKVSPLFSTLQRGDIVQIYDEHKDTFYIKRIIGMPKETILIQNYTTYLITKNEELYKLNEPYIKEQPSDQRSIAQNKDGVFYVPKESYFVIGDNRSHSVDSRDNGSYHRSMIIGKIARPWSTNGDASAQQPILEEPTTQTSQQ